jgi:hypothetical protein
MLIGLNLLSQPAQALNWNFSYTASNVGGEGVAGTVNAILTTDGTDYNTTTTYNTSAISGTANGSSITGLWTTSMPEGDGFTPDNQFKWNGTTGVILSYNGIAFSNSASQVNNIYYTGSLNNFFNSTSGGSLYDPQGNVSASSLTPTAVPWETDALPVIGSTVLFGLGLWTKRKFAKPLQK